MYDGVFSTTTYDSSTKIFIVRLATTVAFSLARLAGGKTRQTRSRQYAAIVLFKTS